MFAVATVMCIFFVLLMHFPVFEKVVLQ